MCEINYDETAYTLIENVFGDYREIVGKASDEIQKIAKKCEQIFDFPIYKARKTWYNIRES